MTELLSFSYLLVPEILILVAAIVVLMLGLFYRQRSQKIPYYGALTALILSALATYGMIGHYPVIILNGLFVADDLAALMKLFIYLSCFLCFIYSSDYLIERKIPLGEYYTLALLSVLGMMVLVSAASMLTVYLGLELLSLPLYAMTAMWRDRLVSNEAAIKYFVMGSVASGLLLYGMSLLYAATGELGLIEIDQRIGLDSGEFVGLLAFAVAFILAAICFKMALVPFHMWAPDVYVGAPSAVTLFLSAAPKIAGMAMIFRLLGMGLGHLLPFWQDILLIIGLLSAGIGNLFAVVQQNMKRMLAYSTVSHMGYAVLGIAAADASGYSASLFYILAYSLMATAAFGLLVLLSKKGYEFESLADFTGLNKRNPWLAFLMMVVMFSMAGIPPSIGFVAKLLVLKSLVDVHLTWAALIALFFAVIGAFYYLYVIKLMYFDEPVDAKKIAVLGQEQMIVSFNALSLLCLGIFPTGLVAAATFVFN